MPCKSHEKSIKNVSLFLQIVKFRKIVIASRRNQIHKSKLNARAVFRQNPRDLAGHFELGHLLGIKIMCICESPYLKDVTHSGRVTCRKSIQTLDHIMGYRIFHANKLSELTLNCYPMDPMKKHYMTYWRRCEVFNSREYISICRPQSCDQFVVTLSR